MNTMLLIIFLFTGFVFLIELAKFDLNKPIHLSSMLLKMFGLCTFYGYVFEPLYVGIDWFKLGLCAYLLGSSLWLVFGQKEITRQSLINDFYALLSVNKHIKK
jgi:hypothetical protein